MKNLCLLILSFILGVSLVGCKEETKSPSNLSPDENQYLKDYKSPAFKWGYIDDTGEETIPAIFDDNRDFSEGAAIVNYQGYWGVIKKDGEYLVVPSFRAIYSYSEGYAVAQNFQSEFMLLNRKGEVHMDIPYKEVHSVHNRRIKVKNELGYLFIDLSGNAISEAVYQNAQDYSEGYAVIQYDNLYGLIDTLGKEIIPSDYQSIKHLYRDYYGVKRNSFWKIFSLKERKELDNEYLSLIQNNTHLIGIKSQNGEWSILDLFQLTETPLSEKYIYPGGEGKWFFRKGMMWGIMDEKGDKMTGPTYNALYRYKDDRCVFNIDDFWGYLDSEGNEVIPPIFPLAWDYHDGLARIITKGGIGFMNKSGNLVISPKFIEVRDFFEGFARFQKVR